ncbi:ribonucleases P/MRP protein subunit POP1-like [Ornithodoros turicata]|uniref:ribonucleases P/MRP protein subunit POP1-like n=1 Tax=Ornithodoros turicata TaxID=34597 RepID=UPI0031395957
MGDPTEYYAKCAEVVAGESSNKSDPVENGHDLAGVQLSRKRPPSDDDTHGPVKSNKIEDSPLFAGMRFPHDVPLLKLLNSRADEIADIVKNVEQKHPKLISQQLPRHMRRRAVSHDKRRLPKRLKDKLGFEPAPPKGKRPSRKHRRRPRNLLAEYARRSRKHVWLETHIWHAKRFKMAEMWGYKIPVHPYDKGIRAAYRGAAHHVLLHDLSFYNCVELIGKQEDLLEKLSLVTSSNTGLTFKAKVYVSGKEEGSTVLYSKSSYPFGAIGKVKFMWRPLASNQRTESHNRQLWIWVHPSIHAQVTEEFIGLFELKKVESADADHCGSTDGAKADTTTDHFERTVLYAGERVSMILLKDNLVRFSLTGPLARAVLTAAFTPSTVGGVECVNEKCWWKTYYREEGKGAQDKLWDQIRTKELRESSLPQRCILGQVVRDPRLLLPKTRTKVDDESTEEQSTRRHTPYELDPSLSDSPIWNPAVRDEVTLSKVSECQLNFLRSQNTLPGTPIELGDKESRVPILAIRKAGSKDRGFGQGWDVILPSGWARPFWIALIYRGARAAGLRELRSMTLQMGELCFPFEHPDTKATRSFEEENRKELMAKHYRYPPDKRPSFQKLGVLCPYFFPWTQLLREWSTTLPPQLTSGGTGDSFFVINDRRILRAIGCTFDKLSAKNPPCIRTALENVCTMAKTSNLNLAQSLVAVHLRSTGKGVPKRFDFICIPTENDNDKQIPFEKLHRVAKQPKKDKKAPKPTQEELLRRPEVNGVVDHCSRKLLGFVVNGDHCFSTARGHAVGYCALAALFSLAEEAVKSKTGPVVLYRHQHSQQYRFARLGILGV